MVRNVEWIIILAVVSIVLGMLSVIFWLFWRQRMLELTAKQSALIDRYVTALQSSIDGYIEVDRDTKIINSNPALSTITGYSATELKSLSIKDLEVLENPEEIAQHQKRMIAAKGDRFCSKWRRKDGEIIDIEASILFTNDVFFAFIRDITAHKLAEEKLRRSNARLDALVACVPVGVYIFFFHDNGAMGFEYVSPRFCQILDLDAKTVLNDFNSVFAKVHPDDLSSLTQANAEASKTLKPFRWEGRFIVRQQVRYLLIESNGTPINAGGSQWHGMIADITERKGIESELARSNAELAQFAYVASHDLRQPLRTISNYIMLLQKKLGNSLDADSKMYMEFVVDGAKRMNALIMGLLEYSRVGRTNTTPEIVPLNTIIVEAIMNLEAIITETSAVLNTEPDLPSVMGYPEELLRLFQNLISNAVKYSAKNQVPEVSIGWHNRPREQVVWVHDNGIGIAPKDHERTFGIFQRLVTKEEYEGTGIGLAICRKIMERHNGRIWIESTLGQGSTFFIAFPKIKCC